MREAGSGGSWATTIGFLIPLLVLFPVALRRWRQTLRSFRELAVAGSCLALGIALYSEGVVRGQIAHVILLFYLTPVWSTLLARLFLAEPITGRRVATIALGLAGMFVIFSIGGAMPVPHTSGDWMGLTAGFSWAVAMVAFNRHKPGPLFDRVFVHFVFLAPVFFVVTLIPESGVSSGLDLFVNEGMLPWILGFALIWVLPVVWLTIFGASRLDPGRVAILLMFEIVIGLLTAALLTDEPLGPRELLGAGLVMSAIAVEIKS